MSTKVTSRGQVIIPKRIRQIYGLEPGTIVDFRLNDAGDIVLVLTDGGKPKSRFAKLLGHAGLGPSTDEIMAMTRGQD